MEDLCDNIGLVLVCLPSGSTDVAASPSQYMIQPSGIPIFSFMHVGDPYISKFDLLVYCVVLPHPSVYSCPLEQDIRILAYTHVLLVHVYICATPA